MLDIKIKYLTLIFIGLVMFSQQVNAGKLDDFERDATKKKIEDKSVGKKDSDEKKSWENDAFGSCFGGCLNAFLSEIFIVSAYFGVVSWRKVDLENSPLQSPLTRENIIVEKRKKGEALIPFARVDMSYQNVESDVQALDSRAELGFGPFGIRIQNTHYKENEPTDKLTINQVHLLYRMSIGNKVELDLGIGGMMIDGEEENAGFSFTTPLLYHPSEHMGIEFKPSWNTVNGNLIKDYDLAFLIGWRYFSIRTGYRWFVSENESLSGPFIGLALYY